MQNYKEMKEYFDRLSDNVNEALLTGIKSKKGILEDAIYYALSVKGKRLRPLLFLSLVDAFDKNAMEFIDIACAIEYIHTYSLIHDDLPAMDNDDFRRGMPTVHKKYDEAIALLAGDTLLTAAFERIAKTPVAPQKIVNIIRILTEGIGKDGMAGGQALDLEFSGPQDKEKIFDIHRMKTAEFIKSVLLSAAEIVDMTDAEKKLLGEAGVSIGIAFQMADDLLDIEGDEKEVGKRLKKDKDNRSPNSVLYFGKDQVAANMERSYQRSLELLKQLAITSPPFLYLMEKMVYRSK